MNLGSYLLSIHLVSENSGEECTSKSMFHVIMVNSSLFVISAVNVKISFIYFFMKFGVSQCYVSQQ